jgi:tetratricopeptide (TPR) repeat protein
MQINRESTMNRTAPIRLCICLLAWSLAGCVTTTSYQRPVYQSIQEQKEPYALVAIAQKHMMLFFKEHKHGRENIEIVIKASEAALKLDPEIGEGHFLLGYALTIKGIVEQNESEMQNGLQHCDRAMTLSPSMAIPKMLLPVRYLLASYIIDNKDSPGKKDIRHAVSLLQHAIHQFPYFYGSHLLLSRAYVTLGSRHLALQEAKVAAESMPDDEKAQIQLGYLYAGNLDPRDEARYFDAAQKGIEAFKKAIRLKPDDPYAHEMIALLYSDVGHKELMLFSIKTAIELENSASRQCTIAEAYLAFGKVEEAETHYREAIDLKKDYPRALNALAFCLYLKGEYALSMQVFQDYLKASDKASLTYAVLRYFNCLSGLGKNTEAENYLRKYYKSFSGDAWEKCLIEYHLGLMTKEVLLSKAKGSFDRCEAYFYIGSRYWHSGRQQTAAQWFEKTKQTNAYSYFEYNGASIRLEQMGRGLRAVDGKSAGSPGSIDRCDNNTDKRPCTTRTATPASGW